MMAALESASASGAERIVLMRHRHQTATYASLLAEQGVAQERFGDALEWPGVTAPQTIGDAMGAVEARRLPYCEVPGIADSTSGLGSPSWYMMRPGHDLA